jgi:TolB-like protein
MIIQFEDFFLDSEGYALKKGETAISVEPQVFSLLLYLVENRDRLISKDELIEHVWDGRIVSDAAITSAINLARRAVADDGRNQAVIRTFPKRGFRFVAKVTEFQDEKSAPSDAAAPPHSGTGHVSLAVLPFENLSNDPEQEFFCDGVVEAIVTDLSKLTGIAVIARNSSFAYKGKSVDIRQVARELNVSHVLEGSVQKSVDRVRISAQLIDAVSNAQLWGERYDGRLDDVFALQDEISQNIISSLEVNLNVAEAERLSSAHVPVKEAYDYYVRGKYAVHPPTAEHLREATIYFKQAIKLDPDFAGGHAGMALVSAFEGYFGSVSNTDLGQTQDRGLSLAKRAVSLDPNFGWAYVPLGFRYLVDGDLDLAARTISNGLAVSPGDADLNAYMGYMHIWQRRGADACKYIEAARKLDPHHGTYRLYHAYAQFVRGDYGEVVDLIENQVPVDRYSPMSFMFLIAAHVRLDNLEQARTAAELAVARYQLVGMENAQRFLPFAEQADRAELLADLSEMF